MAMGFSQKFLLRSRSHGEDFAPYIAKKKYSCEVNFTELALTNVISFAHFNAAEGTDLVKRLAGSLDLEFQTLSLCLLTQASPREILCPSLLGRAKIKTRFSLSSSFSSLKLRILCKVLI